MSEPKPKPLTAEEAAYRARAFQDASWLFGRVEMRRVFAILDSERFAREAAEAANELLNKHLDMVQATNADLRAVVERLPRFEDGPPILPWDMVWTIGQNRDGSFVGLGQVRFYDSDEFADESEKQLVFKGWYSTREAAEAARTEARNAKPE